MSAISAFSASRSAARRSTRSRSAAPATRPPRSATLVGPGFKTRRDRRRGRDRGRHLSEAARAAGRDLPRRRPPRSARSPSRRRSMERPDLPLPEVSQARAAERATSLAAHLDRRFRGQDARDIAVGCGRAPVPRPHHAGLELRRGRRRAAASRRERRPLDARDLHRHRPAVRRDAALIATS